MCALEFVDKALLYNGLDRSWSIDGEITIIRERQGKLRFVHMPIALETNVHQFIHTVQQSHKYISKQQPKNHCHIPAVADEADNLCTLNVIFENENTRNCHTGAAVPRVAVYSNLIHKMYVFVPELAPLKVS